MVRLRSLRDPHPIQGRTARGRRPGDHRADHRAQRRCQLARDDLPPGHASAGEATDVEHAVSLTAKNPNNREVLAGKFTWEVDNFSEFREMIKTQKVMSPSFPAGDCSFRLSVYQSQVHGAECLSMCLESKESDQSAAGAPREARVRWEAIPRPG